ncbi:MAG: Activator of Hsp90 ATPase 1 family protein [Ilumatobacteraceae bacterium]|nr:Activator of Hsp90 ATPase 1 family protein [Ilumatobacteraceae bacterium]
MTHHNQTHIHVDNDVPTIRITREFDAPVGKVFRAHVDPELLMQWNGPKDLTARIDHFDCRTGGSYRYVHTATDGSEYGFRGSFHEVRPDELIVQTFTYEGTPEAVALEKVAMRSLAGGRTLVTVTSLLDSFADRDAFVASGMETGVVEGYDSLDDLLASTD